MQTRNKHYFIFNLLFLLILMGLSSSCANKEETIERILLEKELFDQADDKYAPSEDLPRKLSQSLFMLILSQQTMRLPYQLLIGLSACILIIQI